MQTVNQSDSILEVSFIQHPYNLMTSEISDGYFKVIRQFIKDNMIIQKFELFNDARLQNMKCPLIRKELEANHRNKRKSRYFSRLPNEAHTAFEKITLKNIKLWLKYRVQVVIEELWSEDLENLEHYLKNKQHKIVILDISSPALSQSEVDKVVEVLNKPSVNNSNIDIIKLGKRKYDTKSLILACKWILNKFSEKNEREYFNVKDYLLSFSHILTFNDEDEQNEREKQEKLVESNNMRK